MRAADRLADAVELMIERGLIDARSPAADALLDYNSADNQPHRDVFRLAPREHEI